MRDVDPTIVIVGPDLNVYDDTIRSELLTGTGATAGSNICGGYAGADGNNHYYLDVVAFHTYPFPNKDEDDNIITQTRQEVIDQPSDFEANLNDLKTLVNLCNQNRPSEPLKMAVTEINVEYLNPADLSLSGVSAQSFLAGQYWADVMNVGMKKGLEFMAFWSVKEGGPKLGYITGNDNTKLPTYYHYQMLAQNFRGVYAEATSVLVNNGLDPNVKAFGAKDLDQIVVMLLNQQQSPAPALTYTVRLDGGTVNGSKALKVSINAGVAKQYNYPGAGGKLAAESTVMLVFNQNGDLLHRYVYDMSNAITGPTVTPPL